MLHGTYRKWIFFHDDNFAHKEAFIYGQHFVNPNGAFASALFSDEYVPYNV